MLTLTKPAVKVIPVGVQECCFCRDAVNPNTVHTRFHFKFCSESCLDAFDERNDYGHQQEPAEETEFDYN